MYSEKSIQTLAFASVYLDDYDDDYHYRYIFRQYSEFFSTPLHEVYDLPLDFVLQNYYEARYEKMSEEDREKLRVLIAETAEKRQARLLKEEADKADADQFAKLIAKEEREAAEQEARKALKGESKGFQKYQSPDSKPSPMFEAGLAPKPEINMQFIDEGEFEGLLSGYGSMPSVTRPR